MLQRQTAQYRDDEHADGDDEEGEDAIIECVWRTTSSISSLKEQTESEMEERKRREKRKKAC